MKSVNSTAPADWDTEHSLRESYLSSEIQSEYSTVPAYLDHRTVVGGVFPFFQRYNLLSQPSGPQYTRWGSNSSLEQYSQSILQSQLTWTTENSLGVSFLSWWIQSVYSTAPADWATKHSLRESFLSWKIQSVHSTVPAYLDHRTLVGGVIPLFRDTVGVFYNPSLLGPRNTR